MSLRFDDLNSVGEPYTENYFRQLVVAIEATPAFLGGPLPGKVIFVEGTAPDAFATGCAKRL